MAQKVSKEALQRWQERVVLITSSKFVAAESERDQADRIARSRRDYPYFVGTYFPHLATCECGKFQIDAAKYVRKNMAALCVFEWARGHAKSTHLSLLIPLWLKIQESREFNTMVLVSKSYDSAAMLLSDLQAELESNELFIRDFGTQVAAGSWTAGRFITADGCMFAAIGRGQSPRGLKNRGKRPDYIVIDDIDDDQMVRSDARVRGGVDWCLTALFGATDMGRSRFIVVGNRIAQKSILAALTERPGFHHTIVNAIDRRGKVSWSAKYTLDEIMRIRTTLGERRFNKEYMNNPITEGAIFQLQHIRYGKILPLKDYRSLICYTDPSFKDGATSDYKATVLVGKTSIGEYHVIMAHVAQTSVSNMIAWHYEINSYVDGKVAVRYYMESNFIQQLILDEFRKAGELCAQHIPVVGDFRRKPDKFARIEAMQPLFERGLVVLNEAQKEKPGMMQLVEQLLMFERGARAHDDAPDALEGAIFLLTRRGTTSNTTFRYGARESRKY